jgi:large subunit ribosomal protein L25
MSNVVLNVEKRSDSELKKNASRRLRASEFVPGTIYGLNLEPVSIKVNAVKFKDVLKGRSMANLILDMHIKDDGEEKKEITLIKEIQKHPINSKLIHIDFIRIQMKKEVETSVPVIILNEEESIGVKEDGGVIQHSLREIHVACLPTDIPENIEIDLLELHLGDSVRVENIDLGEKIKILSNPEEVIVSIIHPTHLVIEEPEVEEEEELEEEVEEPEVIGKDKEGKEEEVPEAEAKDKDKVKDKDKEEKKS